MNTTRTLTAFAALASLLALAACARDDDAGTGAPQAAPSAPPAAADVPSPTTPAGTGAADARGVVVYEDYAAVVARRGDTVEDMAARVGVSPSALAAYNGLPTNYVPKAGDELVLPPRDGGYDLEPSAAVAPSPAPSASASASAAQPLSEAPSRTAAAEAPARTGATGGSDWDPARIGAAIADAPESASAGSRTAQPPAPSAGEGYRDVAYHEVERDETVYSIARDYGVSAQTLIDWNALSGPSYSVSPGQVLVIPTTEGRPLAQASIGPPGAAGDAVPPPSADRPLPPDTQRPRPLASPDLGRYQTETGAAAAQPQPAETPESAATPQPAAPAEAQTRTAVLSPGAFVRPVPGEIVRPYSRDPGAARNDGVDFAAQPGQPVRAAAGGTVALVSTSLGEWGNIVLIRHDDRMMTVYGRMGAVTVSKGETVQAGDVIGDVAAPEDGAPTLHFEVRRGAFSEDPADYL